MELPHVLAIAKLRASVAHQRSEELALRTVVTTSESENVKKQAELELIAEKITADLEEIKRFEAE